MFANHLFQSPRGRILLNIANGFLKNNLRICKRKYFQCNSGTCYLNHAMSCFENEEFFHEMNNFFDFQSLLKIHTYNFLGLSRTVV